MDMELVQFHPTGMVAPEEAAGTLVTEAVRGEGGRLYNADGERFMARYDPERMELSTRDRVALANYTEIAEGRGGPHGGVFLDITHVGKDVILAKLPRMYRQFIEYQMLDISREPMEVAPTAHYSMGGIVVEPETHATDVVGLYAAGECTAGLHGANRLGGNSLTETIVFGRRAGEAAAAFSAGSDVALRPRRVIDEASDELDAMVGPGSRARPPAPAGAARPHVGAVRRRPRRAGLRDGLARLDEIRACRRRRRRAAERRRLVRPRPALDLRAGLLVAEATMRGALARRESRGCHNRTDFPELDPALHVNFHTRLGDDGRPVEPWSAPVEPVPDELLPWLDRAGPRRPCRTSPRIALRRQRAGGGGHEAAGGVVRAHGGRLNPCLLYADVPLAACRHRTACTRTPSTRSASSSVSPEARRRTIGASRASSSR